MLETRLHSVPSQYLFLFFVLCLCLIGKVEGEKRQCFFPNGNKADSDTNCNAGTESVCCGRGFVCLENGVCMDNSTMVDGKIAGTLWRGSCTDSTWNSPLCPKYCNLPSGPLQGNLGSGQALGKCPGSDNTFYCKRDGLINICADPDTQFVIQGSAIPINTIPVVEPTVVTSTQGGGNIVVVSTTIEASITDYTYTPTANGEKPAASTSTATSQPSSNPPSYASQHGLAIGLGVGLSTALLSFILLALYIFYKHHHEKLEVEELYKGPPPIRPMRPDVNSPFDHRGIGDPIVLGKYALIHRSSDRDGDTDHSDLERESERERKGMRSLSPPVLDPIILPPVSVPIGIAVGSPRWV
ncbi:hypothetical protein HYALB_00005406 [Hymenoscyphus albidus]|uniref:Uncharacterized protein n=1 Tax=Hymenoscyphus albidus TaxID=595503 RepID=A0A9N9LAB9_9HELO|nr:hypothetical protein HYALB_00005406 [Hymenoscyphus albidus]